MTGEAFLLALLEELDNMKYDTEDAEADYTDGFHRALESISFWARDKLKELSGE